MPRVLLIDHKNIVDIAADATIYFDSGREDVDRYISDYILPQIESKSYDVIVLKDSLSDNYLSFMGLRLAHHIRLHDIYKPIMIVSEIDALQINRLTELGRILFTPAVYHVVNQKEEIEKRVSSIRELDISDRFGEFLNRIIIPKPEQSSHHDIANSWAIERWARALCCESEVIKRNRDKISYMLYFKYLNYRYKMRHPDETHYAPKLQKRGRVLYIDDEVGSGWGDLMRELFSESGVDFVPIEYPFRDSNAFRMLQDLKREIIEVDPDVVILDLRLVESDHHHDKEIASLSGIKILNEIREINPAIQTIMMSASRQNSILEELYRYGIVGYVKKDHPLQSHEPASNAIAKLTHLVDEGLKKKWLKEVWEITQNISNILADNPFERYSDKSKRHCDILKKEIAYIFEVLNSDMQNSLLYAVISMALCVETIIKIFIDCPYDAKERKIMPCTYLGDEIGINFKNVPEKMIFIIEKLSKGSIERPKKYALYDLNTMRNDYVHSNKNITPQTNQILKWLKTLELVFEKMRY